MIKSGFCAFGASILFGGLALAAVVTWTVMRPGAWLRARRERAKVAEQMRVQPIRALRKR